MLIERYFEHPDDFAVGQQAAQGQPYISVQEVEVWLGHSLPPTIYQRTYKMSNQLPKGKRAVLDHLKSMEIEHMLSAIRIDGQSLSDMQTPEQIAMFHEKALDQIASFIEAAIQSGLDHDEIVSEFSQLFK